MHLVPWRSPISKARIDNGCVSTRIPAWVTLLSQSDKSQILGSFIVHAFAHLIVVPTDQSNDHSHRPQEGGSMATKRPSSPYQIPAPFAVIERILRLFSHPSFPIHQGLPKPAPITQMCDPSLRPSSECASSPRCLKPSRDSDLRCAQPVRCTPCPQRP